MTEYHDFDEYNLVLKLKYKPKRLIKLNDDIFTDTHQKLLVKEFDKINTNLSEAMIKIEHMNYYIYEITEEDISNYEWLVKHSNNTPDILYKQTAPKSNIILSFFDGYFFYYNHEFEEEMLAEINNNSEILKGLEIITWDEFLINRIIK